MKVEFNTVTSHTLLQNIWSREYSLTFTFWHRSKVLLSRQAIFSKVYIKESLMAIVNASPMIDLPVNYVSFQHSQKWILLIRCIAWVCYSGSDKNILRPACNFCCILSHSVTLFIHLFISCTTRFTLHFRVYRKPCRKCQPDFL